MPELPDVETFKRYMNATCLHKKISGIDVLNRDILHGVSEGRLGAALEGHKFAATHRHGKYLFAALDSDTWLTLHYCPKCQRA